MGAAIGIALLAAESRIRCAAIGLMHTRCYERIIADAAQIACPLLFSLHWDDSRVPRHEAFDLFDTIGSPDKRLHAHPGDHGDFSGEEIAAAEGFLATHLADELEAYLATRRRATAGLIQPATRLPLLAPQAGPTGRLAHLLDTDWQQLPRLGPHAADRVPRTCRSRDRRGFRCPPALRRGTVGTSSAIKRAPCQIATLGPRRKALQITPCFATPCFATRSLRRGACDAGLAAAGPATPGLRCRACDAGLGAAGPATRSLRRRACCGGPRTPGLRCRACCGGPRDAELATPGLLRRAPRRRAWDAEPATPRLRRRACEHVV
jgi:hypothetical protein